MTRALRLTLPVVLSALAGSAFAQDSAPAWFDRALEGTIGPRAATLELRREDDRVNGILDYESDDRDDRDVWVTGTIGPDDRVRLEEHEADRGAMAVLDGRLAYDAVDGIALRGTRIADGDTLPFAFREPGVGIDGFGRLVSRVVSRGDSASGYVTRAEIPTARPSATASAAEAARLHALGLVADSLVRLGMEGFVSGLELDDPYEFGPPFPSTWEVSWSAPTANRAVVSIEFDVYEYYTGAAHPNSHTFTLNWGLAERRRIELGELFRPGPGWLEVVSERAIEQLVERFGEWAMSDDWVREGAGPDAENFAAWTLTPAGLRIVFDPYQVAPYAAGPQIVTIPWDALDGVLDPDRPWTPAGGT